MPERAGGRSATVRGSAIGTVVLPGARIGRHVTVGANSVVTGELPDFCVAVGAPATVIRRYVEGKGWTQVGCDRRRQMSPPSSPGGMQWAMSLPVVKSVTDVGHRAAVTNDSRYGSRSKARSLAVYARRSEMISR